MTSKPQITEASLPPKVAAKDKPEKQTYQRPEGIKKMLTKGKKGSATNVLKSRDGSLSSRNSKQ